MKRGECGYTYPPHCNTTHKLVRDENIGAVLGDILIASSVASLCNWRRPPPPLFLLLLSSDNKVGSEVEEVRF